MREVKKAVFPVAGLGTRFLPATKAMPKEMLPIVDKPLIQYAAEEAIEAGITELVFITGRNKRAIPDHFDKAYELEAELSARGKESTLELVRDIVPPEVLCVYIRQAEALGLGHAVNCARQVIGNEPFAILLADDLINGTPGVVKQMCDIYKETQSSLIGVQVVEPEETGKYGIVDLKTDSPGKLEKIKGIVEKPAPADAPSTHAVIGRYLLNPAIFEMLEHTQPGSGGEIQLTDAIAALIRKEDVYAYQFDGKRYDCGSKIGYLQATVDYALDSQEFSKEFRQYMQNNLK